MQACDPQVRLGQQHTQQSWQDQHVLRLLCDTICHRSQLESSSACAISNTTCISYELATEYHVKQLLLEHWRIFILVL